MAVLTVDKVVLILSVTAIIIVLTYIFRVGWLFRPKQSGPGADSGQGAGRTSSFLTRPGGDLVVGVGRATSNAQAFGQADQGV